MKIDSEERTILSELTQDASVRRKLIAYKVGVSEPTLSKKIATLQDEGYIKKFTIEVDYSKLGYPINAVTVVRLGDQAGGLVDRAIEVLVSLPQTIEVATIVVEWDIYVRWMCSDNAEMISAVRKLLAEFPGSRTETFTLAEFFKCQRGVELIAKGEQKERG